MSKFYITTSIVYTNAKPHIGFALELFQADAIARLHRLLGYEVKYLTGTDEHGLKIFRKAAELNLTPQQYVDQISDQVRQMAVNHQVSFDDFIRTTDQKRHWPAVHKVWRKLAEKKLLERRKYAGLYCVGCERYIKEDELNEKGECPDHLRKPEFLESDNYFFLLSKFTGQVLSAINSGQLNILPVERKNEIIQLLENGLEDVSISREKTQLPWGVPVPDDPDQVIYVWLEALINYISAIDYTNESAEFQKYWPAETHLVGKDILRFHAAIWPAILLAADLPLPETIIVHGHIQSGGQRMSKTIGNVIDPMNISSRYSPSALRLILLKEISAFKDGDLTEERIDEIYQADLANKLGNLVSRVIGMYAKYKDSFDINLGAIGDNNKLPATEFKPFAELNIKIREFEYGQKNYGRTDLLLEEIWQIVKVANEFVEKRQPWVMAKHLNEEDKENNLVEFTKIFYNLFESIRLIALLLEPIDPVTSRLILDAIGQEKFDSSRLAKNPEKYISSLQWGGFDPSVTITTIPPLFPRFE